jgi:hypothetical protein
MPEEISDDATSHHIPRVTHHSSDFGLVETEDNGKHYLALETIRRGTILLRENPFFVVSEDDMPMSVKEKGTNRIFFGGLLLSMNMKYYEPYLAPLRYSKHLHVAIDKAKSFPAEFHDCYLKYHANSFDVDSFKPDFQPIKTALYEQASFFRHSCQPNCAHRFNIDTNEIIIVAQEEIERGAELTICYMGPQYRGCPDDIWYRTVRQSFAKRFGEECQCRRCEPKTRK